MILSNGVNLPALGFGTFQIPPGKECAKVVKEAIDAGYRMIDTAYSYQNEKSVGEGIRNTGVPREEIFLTTKIYMMGADGYAFAKNAFSKVLERLGVDYIDMYMIHMPLLITMGPGGPWKNSTNRAGSECWVSVISAVPIWWISREMWKSCPRSIRLNGIRFISGGKN